MVKHSLRFLAPDLATAYAVLGTDVWELQLFPHAER
jgi:hypothetical protein